MTRINGALLHVGVLWELIRYDLLYPYRGIRGVCPRYGQHGASSRQVNREVESAICEAVVSVVPFYWKPVRCLQRSIVAARLMRRYGVPAELVIGYRAAPFFSHAWVEVAGRVVNDSPSFQRRLQVLERL
jgi:hypothetical protein